MESSDRLPRHLLIGLALALVIYIGFFTVDQHIRTRKGPWEVVFRTNESGWATIDVSQRSLGVKTTISFNGESATNQGAVAFDKPGKKIPFGTVKFEDLTYLPGSVAFHFFGHEVELLPRTLYLNKHEHAWKNGEALELKPGEKLPPGMSYDPRRKRRR
jgi:hypothetical protein